MHACSDVNLLGVIEPGYFCCIAEQSALPHHQQLHQIHSRQHHARASVDLYSCSRNLNDK